MALDRVQKKLPILNDAAIRLRKAGLIEGRKPNLHVSALVANLLTKLRRNKLILNTGTRSQPLWRLAE